MAEEEAKRGNSRSRQQAPNPEYCTLHVTALHEYKLNGEE
jgi:hypothetical protein